jgi:hypothetical protein
MAAENNEERKMIVHRLEATIRQSWEEDHENASRGPEGQSTTYNNAIEKLVNGMLERQMKRSAPEAEKQKSDQQSTAENSRATRKRRLTSSAQKPPRLLRFRESFWDLDRVYYYLLIRYFGTAALRWESSQLPATKANATKQQPASSISPAATEADSMAKAENYDLVCAARDIEMEVERYRARSKGGSLMPLTYGLFALRAICSGPEGRMTDEDRVAIDTAFTLVKEELGEMLKSEPGRPIERLLTEIQTVSLGSQKSMRLISAAAAVPPA